MTVEEEQSTMTATAAAAAAAVAELYQELNDRLDVFCSDAQQKFCMEQNIAPQPQLQRIRQTMQQVQRFMPVVGLVGGPNSESLRQTLTQTVLEILDCYQTACRRRRIRNMSETMIDQLMEDWHHLSQAYDDKSKEYATLTRLMEDVTQLRRAWKRPDQVETIMTSLLASMEARPGMYIVTVDRQNYAQLGLKRKAIGSRQIVFEYSLLSRNDQISAVADLCRRFTTVFMQNAQLNLTQIDSQIHLARPTTLARKLKRLHESVFLADDPSSDETNSDDNDTQPPVIHATERRRTASLTPFRLTAPVTTPSFVWYPARSASSEFPIATMPTPNFVPAPWQWVDLLKPRRPYHPLLFGIIRRHRHQEEQQQQAVLSKTDRLLLEPSSPTEEAPESERGGSEKEDVRMQQQQQQQKGDPPFATLSVSQLCQHLSRVGYQFYEDVANNARLRYHQDSRALQGIGQDLVEIYKSLQLASSRLAMQQILTLLEQLSLVGAEEKHAVSEPSPRQPSSAEPSTAV